MKKLLTTMSAVALAFGLYANAPEPGPLSGTSFEGLAAGDYDITQAGGATDEGGELVAISGGATYWDTNSTATLKIVNEESSVATRPEAYESCTQTNYLSIKTTLGNPVTRYIDADHTQSVAIGDGLYFDSLVNFTAFDDDPQVVTNGEKLAIWLKEVYGNGDSADPTGTNLMITAGYINGDNGLIISNYTCSVPDVNLNNGGWHRVTVKMLGTIFNGQTTPGFVVYVDTKPVVCGDAKFVLPDGVSLTDNAAAFDAQHSLFPSALQSGDNKSLVKAVDFDGQGCVDDIVFTTKAPTFAKDTEFFTIIVDENIATASYSLNGGASVSMAPGSTNALVYTSGSTYFTLSGIAAATGYMTNGVELVGITEDAQQAGKYDVNAVNATATIKAKSLGAYVGDTPFESLAAAVAYVNDTTECPAGSGTYTITLAANATLTEEMEFTNTGITNVLDLAGKTITGASGENVIAVAANVALTIVDSDDNDGGTVTAVGGGNVLANKAGSTLIVEDGTYNGALNLRNSATLMPGSSYSYADNEDEGVFTWPQYVAEGYEATKSGDYWVLTEATPTYTVTFDLNGGSVLAPIAAQSVVSNNLATVPSETPTKEYYTFQFWTEDGTTAFDFANTAIISNTTLTATYAAVSYTIAYMYDGTTLNGLTPATYTVEDAVTLPTENVDLGVVGVTFQAWTNAEGQVVAGWAAGAKTGNQTFYAQVTTLGPSGLDPAAGTTNVTVTAESAADAIAAAKLAITVPDGSGATAAEYAELFIYSATGEGSTYNVAITGIQDSVVTGVSEEAVAVFSGDTAVAIPKGLYYRITPATALPVSGEAQTGLSAGSVTVTKPGTTQGFLKVELSATPFAVPNS